jgi:tRNA modification GTPase
MYTSDTIVAPATASGQGAVAIVRLSGPCAFSILHRLWRPLSGKGLRPRRLLLGEVRNPASGAVIDRAMAVVMPAPKSFTGEDIAEIHCHGGTFIVRQIVAAALDAGARMAAPGEFSRRAFLNGRLDLAEAEAIADLVAAQSESALALALSQLNGTLSRKVRALREQVIAIRAALEAHIDFADEDIALPDTNEIDARCAQLFADLKSLYDSFARGRLLRAGAKAAIIGKPNVGKSSLLNLLLGVDRAIVTPIAGTTRDIIEDTVKLDAYSLTLQDGAGIRETAEVVEQIGVERARTAAAEADLLLVVFDASRPLTDDDRGVITLCLGRPAVAVLNKIDLPPQVGAQELQRSGLTTPVVAVSALRGDGLDELRAELIKMVKAISGETHSESVAVSRQRHRAALGEALAALDCARCGLASRMPPEIVAEDISAVGQALAKITGEVTSEDVLDAIFSEFCIGK